MLFAHVSAVIKFSREYGLFNLEIRKKNQTMEKQRKYWSVSRDDIHVLHEEVHIIIFNQVFLFALFCN